MVPSEASLSTFRLAFAEQEFAKAWPTKSEEQAKSERTSLQQWMQSAEPKEIGERMLGHLDEVILNTKACCAIITYPSDFAGVADTSAGVHCRSLSSRALRCLPGVRRHWYPSAVQKPRHGLIFWVND